MILRPDAFSSSDSQWSWCTNSPSSSSTSVSHSPHAPPRHRYGASTPAASIASSSDRPGGTMTDRPDRARRASNGSPAGGAVNRSEWT